MKATMAGDVGDVEQFAASHEKSALAKASIAAHSAINSLSDRSGPAISRMAHLAHDATDKAINAGTKSAEWMREKNARLADKRGELMESTKSYVASNPLKALAFGFVAGLLLHKIL
jgi:ElaB/YqjD/DUF883 family membrane-anchored ribosome-binding protein